VRVAGRLVVGSLVIIAVFALLVVFTLERRLRVRLTDQTTSTLLREARLISQQWVSGSDPEAIADAAGSALGVRVTLVDSTGRVVGDSEFDEPALSRLENHANRPEVAAARASGSGTARRLSPSAGDIELYAAVRAPLGITRTSISTSTLEQVLAAQLRDVVPVAALVALIAAALVAVAARGFVRPIVALRDETRAIAAGDLSRRPALDAPAEIGDLATAIHRMREQLAVRLAALEADEALFDAVSASLNEGLIAVNGRSDVVRINARARELLSLREPVPFSADRLPRDRMFRDALSAVRSKELVDGLELDIGERTVELTGRPLADGGAVVALFDVTRLRQLERVRRDFVANVSHELKTPLTVIGGVAETLVDNSLTPDERRRFADMIAGNTRRMHRLVDDLLDLSRIESGGWRPAPSAVDLPAVVAEVFAAVRPRVEGRGVALVSDIPNDAAAPYADPTALRQVISNLVDNAVRHTAHGSIRVTARAEGNGVAIRVSDTGDGIAPEHLPRIFERFYRVDAARSRAEGGTGLGLAIVRHLVEAHGGTVAAESSVGTGTTISIFFPIEAPNRALT
jgi:two-component system, OmpR family, phosphate regulon sensor histidine kinase PhoR